MRIISGGKEVGDTETSWGRSTGQMKDLDEGRWGGSGGLVDEAGKTRIPLPTEADGGRVALPCHLLRTVAIRRQVGMRFEVTVFGTSYKVKMWRERKGAESRPGFTAQVSCRYVLVPMI